MTMSFTLRKATLSDIPGIIDAHYDTFRDHPIVLRVLPSSSEQSHEYWRQSLKDEITDRNAEYLVMTDPASSPPDKVVGFAKWLKPRTPHSPPSPAAPAWPEGGDVAFAEQFFGTIGEHHKKATGDRPHWNLEVLGTRPAYQGKGIGRELVQWGLSRADEAGLEAAVAASPAGVSLYTKMGFDALETYQIPSVSYLETSMLRQPKRTEGLVPVSGPGS
ncbi:acyl-CoA N-acyltransferase [Xylariaceae sp. FL0662B]|nr:acyl-CoA N-acyltransferase [Xylariaceae sp. FL0662B]